MPISPDWPRHADHHLRNKSGPGFTAARAQGTSPGRPAMDTTQEDGGKHRRKCVSWKGEGAQCGVLPVSIYAHVDADRVVKIIWA